MVYLFLANGCEEIEALTPVDILRRAEVEVRTVGIGGRKIVSSHGIAIESDIADSEVVLDEKVEAVILPGGMPGTLNLGASDVVKKALAFCNSENKLIAAICAAPTVLKENGILDDKKATVFPTFTEKLGSRYLDEDVVIDHNVITARGMGVSLEFALNVLGKLRTQNLADTIRKAICSSSGGIEGK